MQGDTSIRVLLADDQRLVREGWCTLLDHSSGISVVGQAKDGQEAIELARDLRPAIILMDVNMPRLDGLEATRQIVAQQPGIKILMVTQSLDEALVRSALEHGARGYLSKNDAYAELRPAIVALHANEPYFSKTIREQCPHVVEEPQSRVTVCHHSWQDSAWASLDDRLERAKAEARAHHRLARAVCQQSRMLRDQSRNMRAFTHQLLRMRHSGTSAAG